MGIGLNDDAARLDWMLGCGASPSLLSYGYHADDGRAYATNNSRDRDLHFVRYGEGETVGCGFDAKHNRVYFTKEGRKLAQPGMIPYI
jgi:hypothetical protein